MSNNIQTSETIAFCTNEQPKSTKLENEKRMSERISARCKFIICCVSLFAVLLVGIILLLQIQTNLKNPDMASQNQKIHTPEIWQVIIGNESLGTTEISAQILIIPTRLSARQSLILMHELDIDVKGLNHSHSNNFTVIPDTIIQLNQNYTINKILTNKNESKNVVLYAFAYFYENCFVGCTEEMRCGIAVDVKYSMYCYHEYDSDYHSDSIVMTITLMTDSPDELITNNVSNNLMHQMLSNHYKNTEKINNYRADSLFSTYFDHNIYYEHSWDQFAWSTEPSNFNEDSWNDTKQNWETDHDRRNLQSGINIIDSLPSNFGDDVMNAISLILDDTLWVQQCGFLLDGCDYFKSTIASGSFSAWWAGKYSYGIEDLCVELKALPYIKSKTNKDAGSTQGSIQLEVGLKQYDQNTPALKASFHAYVSQKLCIGLIFTEWCYRDVTDTVDITFEITPSFTLDLNYEILLDIDQKNTTQNNSLAFILRFGLNEIITSLPKCDFKYDLNNDRSLADYFSYLIPFSNILSFLYDNILDFLLQLMDKNICPLLTQYSQQYMSDQLKKLLNNNNQYLTLLNVPNANIQINNGLMYLYHNIWLNSNYDYMFDFQISDACTEILMDCLSNNKLMNAVFEAHIPKDRGSNNANSVWNTDCNSNPTTVPKAIVALWDDNDGFADIDRMKCGGYVDMLTCEYQDNTWIDLSDCYTLGKNDGGSSNPYVKWDTQCKDNYLMTAMYDTNDGFNDVNNWKCCVINTQKYALDYNDCEVIPMNGGTDGGSTAANVMWRAQCSYNYFVVAMYDNDDNFSDIDALKCCSVNKLQSVYI